MAATSPRAQRPRPALQGALVVVALDAATAWFAPRLSLVAALAVCAFFGWQSARAAPERRVKAATNTGLAIGFVDTTVGWLVGWLIAGRPAVSPAQWLLAMIGVSTLASVVGAAAGALARPQTDV